MPDFGYILRGHTPVPANSMREWAEFFEDASRRIVRKTQLTPTIEVSTVFLGMDHNFGREGSPILFETMVFRNESGEEMDRCSTWDEAEAMHERMIEAVCQSDGIRRSGGIDRLIKDLRGKLPKRKPKDNRPTVWQHLFDDEDD